MHLAKLMLRLPLIGRLAVHQRLPKLLWGLAAKRLSAPSRIRVLLGSARKLRWLLHLCQKQPSSKLLWARPLPQGSRCLKALLLAQSRLASPRLSGGPSLLAGRRVQLCRLLQGSPRSLCPLQVRQVQLYPEGPKLRLWAKALTLLVAPFRERQFLLCQAHLSKGRGSLWWAARLTAGRRLVGRFL